MVQVSIFVELYQRTGETLWRYTQASITTLSGVCLHQFWSDFDRASQNYDSDKKLGRTIMPNQIIHVMDKYLHGCGIFLNHIPAPPGVQQFHMSCKGQGVKSTPERPFLSDSPCAEWKMKRFFSFCSSHKSISAEKKKDFFVYVKFHIVFVALAPNEQ